MIGRDAETTSRDRSSAARLLTFQPKSRRILILVRRRAGNPLMTARPSARYADSLSGELLATLESALGSEGGQPDRASSGRRSAAEDPPDVKQD
jgi:hypothetical protein